MRIVYAILLTVLAIQISCTSQEQRIEKKIEMKQKAFLFNMQHFFSDAEYLLSFPLWFNDSVIAANGIKEIKRQIYRQAENEINDLREIRKYYFDPNGIVNELIIEEYYDDRMVGNLTIRYSGKMDEWGYMQEKIIEQNGVELAKSNFKIYEKEEYTDKYLVYRDAYTSDYLFFLKEQKFWGVLSVDSILNPSPNDYVVYGPPQNPVKRFQINNKVNESNVTEYSYHEKYGFVTNVVTDSYPFVNKRSFVYDLEGDFSYFVDSTFSENVYLNKCMSKVSLSKDLLPQSITHEHYVEGDNVGYVENEKFEYEYYTK